MTYKNLFQCYYQARKAQTFYSKCLDENVYNHEEKELLYEIIADAAKTSKKLKNHFNK